MTITFDSFAVEWYNGVGNWIDITEDVIFPIQGDRGIHGTDLNDRMGGIGGLSVTLLNDSTNSAGLAGYYTPGHTNCVSVNWGKPYLYPIRIKMTYEDRTKVLWYGTFEQGPNGVSVDPFTTGKRKVTTRFRDWMGIAQERKLNLLPSASSQRIDQAVQLILNELDSSELPQSKNLTEGISTFAAVFDDTNSGTTVFSEMAKLAQSELGYIYIRSNRTNGETLVCEHRNLRFNTGGFILTSTSSQDTGGSLLLETGDYLLLEDGSKLLLDNTFTNVSRVSKSNAECGALLLENGDYLLLEDGSKLLLNETQEAVFDADDIQYQHGFSVNFYDNAYQSARVSLSQKETGVDIITLWQAENAILIPANGSVTGLRGRYRDPSGGASYINGTDMITPVTSTDWGAWSASDGTGTDLKGNITVVADYGSAEVEYTITNAAGTAAYIVNPKLQARGYGVYNYDSLDFVLGDENGTGKNRLEVNSPYETDSTIGKQYATDIIRNPLGTKTIQRLPLWANKDTFNMNCFMDMDIGTLYNISESQTAVEEDSPYFINGYSFEIFKSSEEGLTVPYQVRWFPNGFPYSRVYIPPT